MLIFTERKSYFRLINSDQIFGYVEIGSVFYSIWLCVIMIMSTWAVFAEQMKMLRPQVQTLQSKINIINCCTDWYIISIMLYLTHIKIITGSRETRKPRPTNGVGTSKKFSQLFRSVSFFKGVFEKSGITWTFTFPFSIKITPPKPKEEINKQKLNVFCPLLICNFWGTHQLLFLYQNFSPTLVWWKSQSLMDLSAFHTLFSRPNT